MAQSKDSLKRGMKAQQKRLKRKEKENGNMLRIMKVENIMQRREMPLKELNEIEKRLRNYNNCTYLEGMNGR